MSKDSVHHQVRQVLMNELGLTRESVRGMMEDLVESIVAKHMRAVPTKELIDKIVCREIEKMAKGGNGQFGKSSIYTMVESSAKMQIADFIKKKIKIDGQ